MYEHGFIMQKDCKIHIQRPFLAYKMKIPRVANPFNQLSLIKDLEILEKLANTEKGREIIEDRVKVQ